MNAPDATVSSEATVSTNALFQSAANACASGKRSTGKLLDV